MSPPVNQSGTVSPATPRAHCMGNPTPTKFPEGPGFLRHGRSPQATSAPQKTAPHTARDAQKPLSTHPTLAEVPLTVLSVRRGAALPSLGAITTANALAHFYLLLGSGSRALFQPATRVAMTTTASRGPDRVLIESTSFSAGFMTNDHGVYGPASGSFGHPGTGGSLAFADPALGSRLCLYSECRAFRRAARPPHPETRCGSLRSSPRGRRFPRRQSSSSARLTLHSRRFQPFVNKARSVAGSARAPLSIVLPPRPFLRTPARRS